MSFQRKAPPGYIERITFEQTLQKQVDEIRAFLTYGDMDLATMGIQTLSVLLVDPESDTDKDIKEKLKQLDEEQALEWDLFSIEFRAFKYSGLFGSPDTVSRRTFRDAGGHIPNDMYFANQKLQALLTLARRHALLLTIRQRGAF